MDASRYVLPGLCLVLASCAAAPRESPSPSQATVPPSASTAAPVAPTADSAPFKSAPTPVPQVTQSAPTPAEAPVPPEASADSSAGSAAAAPSPAAPGGKTTTKATVNKSKSMTPAKAAPATTAPGAVAAAKPASAPALNLTALEQRLRDTKAIGLFTKLSIKNQVDDLLDAFRAHYKGQDPPLTTLRQRYDLLLMKVLSSVQDGDPPLANDIASSREAIWKLLNDPNTLKSA